MVALSILFACLSTLSFDVDDKPIKVDPAMLVGTWEVVKADSPPVGSTVEFTRDGKYESNPKSNTMSGYLGTYKVKDDQVTIDPAGMTATVKELTKTKLVLEFGGTIEYKRKGSVAMPKAVQKSGGFRVGAPPKASGKWQVVKFEKDGFSVEMPGPPNGREGGGGGGFETNSISHQTRSMELIATAIHGPTEVSKSEEAKALESIRDKSVGRYGKDLNLVSEKPVRVGGIEGREFAMTLDRMGAGPMTIWGRAFIRGKTAYVLLAIPVAKGQTLGADAQKFLESFALTDSSEGTMAKPAPRPAAKGSAARKLAANPLKAWGTKVDPDGDVRLKPSATSLAMEIPGTPHVLAPERDKMNAPRVVAPIRGDFVVVVRVDGAFQPGQKSTVKGLSSRQAGGLILWKDSRNYLVFQRRATAEDGKVANQAVLEELVSGSKGATHRQPAPDAATFLRLERKGSRITAAFSNDGEDWKGLKPVDTTWAEGEIQVGVVAVNTSSGPHPVTFDGYSLKTK